MRHPNGRQETVRTALAGGWGSQELDVREWSIVHTFVLICWGAMFAGLVYALALHYGFSSHTIRTDALASADVVGLICAFAYLLA
jgi:hypothetical protein